MLAPEPESYLDRVRYFELSRIGPLFSAVVRVLKIGGGSGYQAAILASQDLQVTSIDINLQGHKYSGNFAELFGFREHAWRERFRMASFRIVECQPAGIFYTGYTLLPRLSMAWRVVLSRLLGSACKIYVVTPAT